MQLLLSPFLVTKTYFAITKKEVRQKTGIVITYVFRHHDLFGERWGSTPITPCQNQQSIDPNKNTHQINIMRTIYSPYKNQNNPSEPSSSHPVKKERASLSSQTLETCPTWTSTDDSLQLNQTFSHESNVENNDPIAAPPSTAKDRKRWIENALLSKKEYTPFNTPAREEYCRNQSNHDLTASRKLWIENTLLTNEKKTYNTKTREEYCKNKDNHELTNERKRWIEETLLTKTNTLPSTPPNKRQKSDHGNMNEDAACEIVEEAQIPVTRQLREFKGPSEIDAELMQKLKQRKQAEAEDEANPRAAQEARQRQLLAEEKARQLELVAEAEAQQRYEEAARQRQLLAEEDARHRHMAEAQARQHQLLAEEEARQRQRMEEEATRQRQQLMTEREARQNNLFQEEARRMEQDRINEEAKLAEEAIAALQKRLDEERLKRELLEEEARLATEARDEEHKRFVELVENSKLFETRIGELEQQEQQRNKMRAYISTLKDEKKLRADELAIVEELEKDIESEDEGEESGDDDETAEEYERYLSNYRNMSEHIATMGTNNISAMAHPTDDNEALSIGSDLSASLCPREETEYARAQIGVQADMPRRTPLVIRSVGSFTDMAEMRQATSAKKHKKRMKLLEKLVKLLGRAMHGQEAAKKYEC